MIVFSNHKIKTYTSVIFASKLIPWGSNDVGGIGDGEDDSDEDDGDDDDGDIDDGGDDGDEEEAYLIFVIFFTQANFLENKIYTEIYTVNRQFTQ